MRKIIPKVAIKKKKVWGLMMSFVAALFYGGIKVFASPSDDMMSEIGEMASQKAAEIAEIFYNNQSFFSKNNWIKDGLRYLEWIFIKLLSGIADGCQGVYRKSIGMADFFNYEGLQDWIGVIQVVCVAIMALSILWYGIILILNHKKKNNILISIMLTGLCISGLTSILGNINIAVKGFCNETVQDNLTNKIINDNFYDLVYIDNNVGLRNMDITESENLAGYRYAKRSVDVDTVDINEVINYDADYISDDASTILKKSVVYFNGYVPGEAHDFWISEVYNGFGWNDGDDADFFNEFYYRYHVEGFQIIVSLVAMIILFICISYKTTKAFIEIPLKRILALFYSHDVTGTQKTMKILGSIKDSYITVMVGAISIKLFYLWQQYLTVKCAESTFAYCIFLIFGTFTLIDGPVLVQTLTGEDAGLQTGAQRLMSVYHGAKGGVRTVARTGAGIASVAISHRRYKKMKDMLSGKDDKSKTEDGKKNIQNDGSGDTPNKDISKDIGNDKKPDNLKEKKIEGNSNEDIQNGKLEKQGNENIGETEKESSLNYFDPSGEEEGNSNEDLRKAMADGIETDSSPRNDKKNQINNLQGNKMTEESGKNNKDISKAKSNSAQSKEKNLAGMGEKAKGNLSGGEIKHESPGSSISNGKENLSSNEGNTGNRKQGSSKQAIKKENLSSPDNRRNSISERTKGVEKGSKESIISGKENLN